MAHGERKRKLAPQTTFDIPKGVPKPSINETELNHESWQGGELILGEKMRAIWETWASSSSQCSFVLCVTTFFRFIRNNTINNFTCFLGAAFWLRSFKFRLKILTFFLSILAWEERSFACERSSKPRSNKPRDWKRKGSFERTGKPGAAMSVNQGWIPDVWPF